MCAVVRATHHFDFLCCVVLFVFVLFRVYLMLSVSLDCPFLIAIFIFFRHIIIFIHIHGSNRGSIDLHNFRDLCVSTCNLLLRIIYVQRNCRMVLHRMKIFSLSKVDSHKKKINTQQFYLNQNNWGKCPVGNFENKVRRWFQSIILIYTRHLLLKCMFQAWKVSTSLY